MENNNQDKDTILKLVANVNKLKNKLNDVKYAEHEPIAVIGMSCRFPGGSNNLDQYWEMLSEGLDAIKDIPKDRFNVDEYYDPNPDAVGTMYVRGGGFMDEVDKFDPEFFGISPREAQAIDPQQRLLLETSWEAFEHAGVTNKLYGSNTGVFVGIAAGDYQSLLLDSASREEIESYMVTGLSANAAAGRLSYTFGLQGPALTTDTACSSSLVAIHLACESLHSGSCDMALAAGVNVILSPEPFILLSKIRSLSPDSHCKTFDKNANGYARGEGCGVIILKRLSDAKKDGDPILATIRGSAVNQDGKSNSFTAPNGLAQEKLIRQALNNAGVKPEQVSYVEAHGTGTPLGDPIEIQALGNVLKEGRSTEYPLVIGTVKTNIGHTESAAGIAGVIKTILSMRHKKIPPHLNFKELNPIIDLDSIPAKIPTSIISWDNFNGTRIAGVSSFGVSGTNAHIIIEEGDANLENIVKEEKNSDPEYSILTISAKNQESLLDLGVKYKEFLNLNKEQKGYYSDIAFSSHSLRTHFNYRAAIVANSCEQAANRIQSWIENGESEGVISSETTTQDLKIAFLFTGGGSQYPGMGKDLYDTNSVYKQAIDDCAEILSKEWQHSLQSIMWGENTALLDQMDYMQPALFALEYAMSQVWLSWGIKPHGVIGHSLGEYVAATIAGIFNLKDGLTLISKRAKLMHQAPGNGAMGSIAASEDDVKKILIDYHGKVTIGAINGPISTIISGDRDAVIQILDYFKSKDIKTKLLPISNASHSPLMESILADFEKEAGYVKYSEPNINVISNVTGKVVNSQEICNAQYWAKHIRQTVRFSDGMKSLYEIGCRYFIEMGPQSTLLNMGQSCVPQTKLGMPEGYWLPSIEKDKSDWEILLQSLGFLYTKGFSIDWSSLDIDYQCSKVQLPTYPFQKKRYWIEAAMHRAGNVNGYGPLIGYKLNTPITQDIILEAAYSVSTLPLIADHKVYNEIIIPGALHVARILDWCTQVLGKEKISIKELSFDQAIVIHQDQTQIVQMILNSISEHSYEINIFSQLEDNSNISQKQDTWSLNATGVLEFDDSGSDVQYNDLNKIKEECNVSIPIDNYNKTLVADRYQYGPGFKWVDNVWVNQNASEALGKMRLPITAEETENYVLPPGFIDCCFQLMSACKINGVAIISQTDVAYIPLSVGAFRLHKIPHGQLWCHATIDQNSNSANKFITGNIEIYSEDGAIVATISQFTAVQAEKNALIKFATKQEENLLYDISWEELHLPDNEIDYIAAEVWVVFVPSSFDDIAQIISRETEENNTNLIFVYKGKSYEKINDNHYVINNFDINEFEKFFSDVQLKYSIDKILYLWALDSDFDKLNSPENLVADQQLFYVPLLYVVQIIAKITSKPELDIVTNGVQFIGLTDLHKLSLSQATLWGFAKVVPLELSDLKCIRIDLDLKNLDLESNIHDLINYLQSYDLQEDQIAIRDNKYYIPRLKHYENKENSEFPIIPESSYLVTGGLGGLGILVAKWLAEKGAKNIILLGRSDPSDTVKNIIEEIKKLNVEVKIFKTDISSTDDVKLLFKEVVKLSNPLRGIIHAAGVLDDALLNDQSYDKFIKVFAPKALGAWNIHQEIVNNNIKLDFFVSFSAAASLLGNVGQSNYTAANAFLDTLAYYQNSLGNNGLSINWGPWASVGMAANMASESQTQLAANGITSISPEKGISTLNYIFTHRPNTSEICVLDINWQRFVDQSGVKIAPMLSGLTTNVRKTNKKIVYDKNNELIQKLVNATTADRKEILNSYLEVELKKLLKFDAEYQLDRKVGLASLGLDSIMAVEVRNRLTAALGTAFTKALPATLMFNYPNIEVLTEYLLSEVLLLEDKKKVVTTKRVQIDEPIAIIGMSCRFPGSANNLDEYWKLLSEGKDAIIEIPKSRFNIDDYYDPDPDTPEKTYVRGGSFLDNIETFDASFFGLGPTEAVAIDPQQRVLLEVVWEALENSRIPIDQLSGSNTGVFVGVMSDDYIQRLLNSSQRDELEAYMIPGNGKSTLAGRISYSFGFQGPNMSVDTACSSSLVTVHLACQSLRDGSSDIAIASGVNVILSPEIYILLSRTRVLAKDAHCKTFDKSADGYARGEGCGAIVLKRLSDAKRDGDNILAIVKGTAVNHDGKSSSLTAPNGVAQEQLISEALNSANIKPSQVGYIEAHGTGTQLGDPIEVNSIGNIFSEGRNPESPLIIGSVKTNLGHTETAAGIAGLIKVVLGLQYNKIPANLNFKELNPEINLDMIPAIVPTKLMDWPAINSRRIAGINSFGISGTNAHVIIESADSYNKHNLIDAKQDYIDRPYNILNLSAKGSDALREMVLSYIQMLEEHRDIKNYLANVAFSTNTTRNKFNTRLSMVAKDSNESIDNLKKWLESGESNSTVSGELINQNAAKIAFLFTGGGSQYSGMGQELYKTNVIFKNNIDECSRILVEDLQFPLQEVMWGEHTDLLDRMDYMQPALFAYEYSMAQVLISWGIEPYALIGHSLGEYVAATIAGVFSLEDGLKLIAKRAYFMHNAAENGAMGSIAATEKDVSIVLQNYIGKVTVGAVNGPYSTIISGYRDSVKEILEDFKSKGFKVKLLPISNASHSPLMEPILEDFSDITKSVKYNEPKIKIISNVTGKIVDAQTICDPQYWVNHIRQTVRFNDGMQSIYDLGCRHFIELGPQPTLLVMGQACVPHDKQGLPDGYWVACADKDKNEWQELLLALSSLYVSGVNIDWQSFDKGYNRQKIQLPNYPFQRKKYWVDYEANSDSVYHNTKYSLLGVMIKSSSHINETIFDSEISLGLYPYLIDHQVYGNVIVPGAVFIEMALDAAKEIFLDKLENNNIAINSLLIAQPLVLNSNDKQYVKKLQIVIELIENEYVFKIESLDKSSSLNVWEHHASGVLSIVPDAHDTTIIVEDFKNIFDDAVSVSELYQKFDSVGIEYGSTFCGINKIHKNKIKKEVFGEVSLDGSLKNTSYIINPALLDACLQVSAAIWFDDNSANDNPNAYMPFEVEQIILHKQITKDLFVYAKGLESSDAKTKKAELNIYDDSGDLVIEIRGFSVVEADKHEMLKRISSIRDVNIQDLFYDVKWRESSIQIQEQVNSKKIAWVIVAEDDAKVDTLKAKIAALNEFVHVVNFKQIIQENAIVDIFKDEAVDEYNLICLFNGEHQMDAMATPECLYMKALTLTKYLIATKRPIKLYFVTKGAHSVNESQVKFDLIQSPLIGLGRVIGIEHPELYYKNIDLDPELELIDLNNIDALYNEVISSSLENQVAYRSGSRFVPRLQRHIMELNPYTDDVYLHFSERGAIDNLKFLPLTNSEVGSNDIKIEVIATGLNFRDVLNVMGLYPGDAGNLGRECAGKVIEVGSDSGFKVGDEVVALIPSAFSKFVTIPADFAVMKPENIDFENAAGIPIIFLTAYQALISTANLKAGEKILIHSAAGGVGLAAIQFAKNLGAEIFVTVGSEAKRELMLNIGIAPDHIMNSRNTDYSEQIMKLTDNVGIDVILNTLTGADFIPKSLSTLSTNGRFLEISKRDIWTEEQVHNFRNDIQYYILMLDILSEKEPQLVNKMLLDIMHQFESKILTPVLTTVYPITKIKDVFRFMAQGKHIGKLVISWNLDNKSNMIFSPVAINPEVSYLVTGGLGALGLEVAKWLAECGANHLILIGRHAPNTEAQKVISDLTDGYPKLEIKIMQVDISNLKSVETMIEEINLSMPKLKGVIHSAAVLEDATIMQQDFDKYLNVISPKILGAWNLYKVINNNDNGADLDFFISFSSATAVFGNIGQANYAAANTFLDLFASYQRANKVNALSINWGAWSQIGLAANMDKASQEQLFLNGIVPFSPEKGIQALERITSGTNENSNVIALDVDWKIFMSQIENSDNPLLVDIKKTIKSKKKASLDKKNEFIQKLINASKTDRLELVSAYLESIVKSVLGLSESMDIDRKTGFNALGVDSLMAVEFRNKIIKDLGDAFTKALPATLIFNYPNIESLTEYLLSEVLSIEDKKVATAVKRIKSNEPIAVIGMSCRFPGGANDLDEYWRILSEGVDTIIEIPKDRFNVDDYYDPNPDAPEKMYIRNGGFLDNVTDFDAKFFSIAPKEAVALDPQQRILHEVVWESLENSGIPIDTLYGSKTGVFVGVTSEEYASILIDSPQRDTFESHIITGNTLSVLAGRISYTLGFQGPAMTVDTACSSSLVSIHLACQSLRDGESNLALAAGVNLILTPLGYILFSRAHAYAPDGHCKTFDAAADGFTRSEGCGVVVLKRLSDATKDGDKILAIIRGSAVNQDGRSSSLTAPNGISQEQLIIDALSVSDIDPYQISYIEAHGTGTPLGDPIEVNSLGRVYSDNRSNENPLIIGSVKTNIGHTEGAAGIAGIIKTILALQHKQIPAHLNLHTLNPEIDLESIPAIIPSKLMDWPTIDGKRVAGVSSFGISGTNAHIILEEAQEKIVDVEYSKSDIERPGNILTISAKDAPALHSLANKYVQLLDNGKDLPGYYANVAYSTNTGRTVFNHRLAVISNNINDANQKLQAWLQHGTAKGVLSNELLSQNPPKIAYLFTGQGAQYIGMGKSLYDTNLTFKNTLDMCANILDKNKYLDKNLLSILWGEDSNLIDETKYTQPALFAFEYALYQLWISWGITPAAVVGHSVGEYVAACVAGVFSLEDGLKLISKRAELMQSLPRNGAMLAIAASEELVLEEIKPFENQISIAAVNSPESVVISGNADVVKEMAVKFSEKGARVKELQVSHAFHSHLLDPMLPDFEVVLSDIKFSNPAITLISNLTGAVISGEEMASPEYWLKHTRNAVRFSDGINVLIKLGITSLIEIGPQPVLLGMAQECLSSADSYKYNFMPSMRRDSDLWTELLTSLGTLYVTGTAINWKNFDHDYNRNKVKLPTYPFQRQRYWVDQGNTLKRHMPKQEHGFLGRIIKSATHDNVISFNSELSTSLYPFLLDHKVYENIIVPGAAYIEMAVSAANNLFSKQLNNNKIIEIQNILIDQPLVLSESPDATSKPVQVAIESIDENKSRYKWSIFSLQQDKWIKHASGVITLTDNTAKPIVISDIKQRCNVKTSSQEIYQDLSTIGLEYGASFQGLEVLYTNADEALGEIIAPIEIKNDNEYLLHPAFLDACFHVMVGLFSSQGAKNSDIYLPFEIEKIDFYGELSKEVIAYARRRTFSDDKVKIADVYIYDKNGNLLVDITGFSAVKANKLEFEKLIKTQLSHKVNDLLYAIQWRDQVFTQKSMSKDNKRWIIFANNVNLYEIVKAAVESLGDKVILGDFNNLDSLDITDDTLKIDRVVYVANSAATIDRIDDDDCEYAKVLLLTQKLITSKALNVNGALIFVTQGAQCVNDTQTKFALAQSTLIGLSRVIAIEQPELNCRMIDLDPNYDIKVELAKEYLIQELNGDVAEVESQIAFRNESRFVPRLTRYVEDLNIDSNNILIKPDATYLITGGLGGLGLEVAKWLSDKGAKSLALIGRGKPSAQSIEVIANLAQNEVVVDVIQADISKLQDVENIFAKFSSNPKHIKGIIHAAGVLDDANLINQNFDKYLKVISPKILGAWNLQTVIKTYNLNQEIDFFVSFSSSTSIFGNIGQSNYAAANSFLDTLSFYQRQNDVLGFSINWGAWASVGLAANMDKEMLAQMDLIGIKAFNPQIGIAALEQILINNSSQNEIVVLDIDWQRYLTQIGSHVPLYSEIAKSVLKKSNNASKFNNKLILELKNSDLLGKTQIIKNFLESEVKMVIGLDVNDHIDVNATFASLGMDSLMSVDLRNRITRALGDISSKALPATLLFSHPTIDSLTSFMINDVLNFGDKSLSKASETRIPEWLTIPIPRPNAKHRLFCFLYVGGLVESYFSWANEISEEIEICIVSPFSVFYDFTEPSKYNLDYMLSEMSLVLQPYLEAKPFSIFGHSMGSAIAFEFTRYISKKLDLQAKKLFISSFPTTENYSDNSSLGPSNPTINEAMFMPENMPQQIASDENWITEYKERIRKDYMCFSSVALDLSPINIDIELFWGVSDSLFNIKYSENWPKFTTGTFKMITLSGGHFDIFNDINRKIVLHEISNFVLSQNNFT